jgi:hypothetical protein
VLTRRRRAGGSVTALLALTLLVVTVAAVGVIGPATAGRASTDQPNQSPVSLAITRISPQWATPRSVITVSGQLTNVSKQQISHLTVQLFSGDVITSVSELQQDAADPGYLAGDLVQGATWQLAAGLAPGGTIGWSIRVHAAALGMTGFGVYPITAEAESYDLPPALASSASFLPYLPAKHGPYAGTLPRRPQRIAWLWPLIGDPLLAPLGQSDCAVPQATQLAASLARNGTLGELLAVGREYSATDQLTWAVDPALVADASAIGQCSARPGVAKAATSWLTGLVQGTRGQPLFVTPYADVDVSALVRQGDSAGVQLAYQLGRLAASGPLRRDLSSAQAASAAPGSAGQVAAFGWAPDGLSGSVPQRNGTLNALAAPGIGIRTLLLGDSSAGAPPGRVFRVLTGIGTYVTVLRSSDDLTSLLGSATSAPGSAFGTAQEFLAETMLMTGQGQGAIIVTPPAPPKLWQPPAGLAASLLAETAEAPWLSPVSLPSLTAGRAATGQLPAASVSYPSYGRAFLRGLAALGQQVSQLQALQAAPQQRQDLNLAVAALESSAWEGTPQPPLLGLISKDIKYVEKQQLGVRIVADDRYTLGGLKGTVPVSVVNGLNYAVTVQLKVQYDQPPGGGTVSIAATPVGTLTIPKNSAQPVKLRVHTTQVGSTTISLALVNVNGQPLPSPTVTTTVQATQFGTLAMIILAAALGVFMIASAARAIRRGRPAPAGPAAGPVVASTVPAGTVPAGTGGGRGSQRAAEPDNVLAEGTELGTAGTSGP